MSHDALTWVRQCFKLQKELLPNELKLRDEGALKTFTLFLLGFILMAGLQALEAYLDMWYFVSDWYFSCRNYNKYVCQV